ncbi:hypothetical protein I316_07744 [Kwoniella heveanensis BCC8398]|uniref:Uncharacterized protein n=1 Tax=Kwoniella heveanensis BCC8398 TaxID=1296120 RepID=A0A1B9GHX6_9TREE|nr:hypothetical protein I316_07744 [Kwoniella heveanensis BCC8398]
MSAPFFRRSGQHRFRSSAAFLLSGTAAVVVTSTVGYLAYGQIKRLHGPHPSLSSFRTQTQTRCQADPSHEQSSSSPYPLQRLYPSARLAHPPSDHVHAHAHAHENSHVASAGRGTNASVNGTALASGQGPESNLILAPTQIEMAREDDTLIENIVLYLG